MGPPDSAVTLAVMPSGGELLEQATATLQCRVGARRPLDLVRIVRLADGVEEEVATHGQLVEPYRGTGRFAITAWQPNHGFMELTITGAVSS